MRLLVALFSLTLATCGGFDLPLACVADADCPSQQLCSEDGACVAEGAAEGEGEGEGSPGEGEGEGAAGEGEGEGAAGEGEGEGAAGEGEGEGAAGEGEGEGEGAAGEGEGEGEGELGSGKCSTPYVLTAGLHAGDTTTATDQVATACGTDLDPDDVWLYTAPQDGGGSVRFVLRSAGGQSFVVSNGCGFTELSCRSSDTPLDLFISPGASVTLVVFANTPSGSPGPYALSVADGSDPCGNGISDPGEECDDGARFPGDGCDARCRFEATVDETEPNDDGTPTSGAPNTNLNDFNATARVNADAHPIGADASVRGHLTPAGDEDTFAIVNPFARAATVDLDVIGGVTPCSPAFGETDTVLNVFNAAGSFLRANDDKAFPLDQCSTISAVALGPNEKIYAVVSAFDDSVVIDRYLLRVRFH